VRCCGRGTRRSVDHALHRCALPGEFADIKRCLEEIAASTPSPTSSSRTAARSFTRTTGSSAKSAWNTFRDHLILEYEIPKYDGGLGSPRCSCRSPRHGAPQGRPADARSFKTQHGKQWFTRATFQGLMRLRGIECNAPSGYAEAFYSRKLVIGPLQ
jgi:hypothetical protein